MRKGIFATGLVFLITLAVAFIPAVSAELLSVDPCQGSIFVSQKDGFFNFYSKCFTVSIAEDYSSAVFRDEYSKVPFELFINGYHDVNADNTAEFKEFLLRDLGMTGKFNLKGNGVFFTSNDGTVRVNYFVDGNKFEVSYEQDKWASGYLNGMLVVNTLATKDAKAASSFVSKPAEVDSIIQPLSVSKEKVVDKDYIKQVAFVGSSFESLVLDPIYQVDYSPIPAEHLINGTVESYNDSQFGQLLNITSGVSDSNDSTQYLVFNSTYSSGGAVSYNYFKDGGTNDTDKVIVLDSTVSTSSVDWFNLNHATINITGVGKLYSGNIIRFYITSPDTTSQGKTIYIANPANVSQYYGSFVNPVGTGYYEWKNVTLSGISSGGVNSVWILDDGQTGNVKIRVDYIGINNSVVQGGQAITGRWNQTYDALYQWFLLVKKMTSGTTTGRIYAYYNNVSINTTKYVTASLAGAGWFNINVSSLIQYETQVAGLSHTQLRFYAYDSINISEVYLRKETNDTQSPQFSSCQVNDSSLVNNEVARFQCNVTDNMNVGSVNGTVEGVTYNFIKDGDVYHYDWACVAQNLFVDWTLIQAVDILGNYNSTNPGITISCNYDSTPPVVAITSPQNISYNVNFVALNVSANEPVNTWRYSLDSGSNVTFVPNTTLSGLFDGSRHMVIYANDSYGNIGSSQVWFTVDVGAPVITVYSPINGTVYSSTSVPLQVSADEPTSAWWYFLDGAVSPTYFSPNTTLSGLSQGLHNISVYANDTSGNGGTSGVKYFTVDTVSPTVGIVSPANASYNVSVVWLEVTADEPISSWVYSLDSAPNVSFTPNVSLSGLSFGSHHVEVYGTDFASYDGYDSVWFVVTTNMTYNYTGNLSLSIYYPPMTSIGHSTRIYAIVQMGGVDYPFANVDISIDGGSNVSMTWNSTSDSYIVDWVPSASGIYNFTVYASGSGMLSEEGSIFVPAGTYDVCIRLWTNINMTSGSNYMNEFSWVFAEYRPGVETLHTIFESDAEYSCPPQSLHPQACMWHDKYQNGSVCVTLYMPGNYTFWIVGENVEWKQDIGNGYIQDCEFCNFRVIRKQFLQNLGEYRFNGDMNENLDLYFNPNELYVGGAFFGFLSSWFFIIIYAVIGFVAFIFTLYATGSVKSALAIMVLLPTIINLIVAYSGILP